MEQKLSWQFHKLSFLLEKAADDALKKQLDIGYAQYKVLEAVNHNTLARQNTVAEMLDQTEASISRQVRILEKKGLIKISDVMGNRRSKELSLTTVGEEMVQNAGETIVMSQEKFFSKIGQNDKQRLLIVLEQMLTANKKNERYFST